MSWNSNPLEGMFSSESLVKSISIIYSEALNKIICLSSTTHELKQAHHCLVFQMPISEIMLYFFCLVLFINDIEFRSSLRTCFSVKTVICGCSCSLLYPASPSCFLVFLLWVACVGGIAGLLLLFQ